MEKESRVKGKRSREERKAKRPKCTVGQEEGLVQQQRIESEQGVRTADRETVQKAPEMQEWVISSFFIFFPNARCAIRTGPEIEPTQITHATSVKSPSPKLFHSIIC